MKDRVIVKSWGVVCIGVQGEHNVTEVEFTFLPEWRDEYGSGTVSGFMSSVCDNTVHDIDVTVSGDKIIWTVSSEDTMYHGYGAVTIVYTLPNGLRASRSITTLVQPSIF